MRRLRVVLGVMAALVVAAPGTACINTFLSNFMVYVRRGDVQEIARELAQAEASYRQSPTFENANDVAVGWIIVGRREQGIDLLRDLERKNPKSAVVASNLGTALELTGQNEEALRWIRESVRRDSREHQGSEWVHVKILEAKVAMAGDAQWLSKHPVIDWSPKQPVLDENGKRRLDEEVESSIRYQLFERAAFVGKTDAIVGDLYATLGDMNYARIQNAGDSMPEVMASSDYEAALEYGTVHEARIRPLKDALDRRLDAEIQAASKKNVAADLQARQRTANQQSQRIRAAWVFGSLAGALALGLFWFRRVRKP